MDLDAAKEVVKVGTWEKRRYSWTLTIGGSTKAQIFEIEFHMPKDPIKKLAVLILAGDPIALDAARDVLKS